MTWGIAVWLGSSPAAATDAFDPTAPEVRLDGPETWDHEGIVRLWAAIERWDDPDRTLFHPEQFNDGTAWRDAVHSPFVAAAFGTSTPISSTFLLHEGPRAASAAGTPILLVPGAGDNASRAFVTLVPALEATGRPVFALTFAHPQGDLFLQAEVVADALRVIEARTGATEVDVVAHSKGGLATAVYAASAEAEGLGHPAYADRGTRYRGDIRRLVLIAVPLAGVDTAYRWSGLNLVALDADTAVSPTSWSRYYPGGTGLPGWSVDLADQDHLPDGRDLFPGQRQVLSRQPAPLPGSRPWLGPYALQQDWLTTYEGGIGFVSWSSGIDAAVEAGGDLIARLAAVGIDPGIEVFQLAGTSPLLVSGDERLSAWFDWLGAAVDYRALLDALCLHGVPITADGAELAALEDGELVLGEISAPSDGLVFVSSATDDRAISARGGAVAERAEVDLAHLDLLYASPVTGQLLLDAADAGPPEDAWLRSLGERYVRADTVGWVVRVLEDGASGTAAPGDPDPGDPDPGATGAGAAPDAAGRAGGPGRDRPSGCDAGGTGTGAGGVALLLVVTLLRPWRGPRRTASG